MDLFKCFEENCGGTVRKEKINYKCQLGNGDTIIVNDLMVEKCNRCGELLFDSAASRRIESEITKKYPNHFKKWEK